MTDKPDDEDPYFVCRYVRHYHQKNGYAPTRALLGVSEDYLALLVKNGIVEVLSTRESGPPIGVVLTEKGERMAESRRPRQR